MKYRLLTLLAVCTVSISSAATINVPGDQPNIQAGINAATAGADVVLVADGTYNEFIDINKNIVVQAANVGGATITGSGLPFGGAVTLSATGATIDGFNVTNSPFRGIDVIGAGTFTINNCVVTGSGQSTGDNTESSGLVVDPLGGTATVNINDSSFSQNTGRGWTFDFAGTVIINADTVTIDDNNELGIISGNPGGALSVTMNLTNVDLTNNARGIIDFTPGSTVVYNGGTIANNSAVGWQTDNVSGRNHSFTNVTCSDNGESGFGLFGAGAYSWTDCTIENNTFEGVARFFNPNAAGSTYTFSGTTVQGNGGAGMRIDVSGGAEAMTLSVSDSSFVGNGGEGAVQFFGFDGGVKNVTAERSIFAQGSGTITPFFYIAEGTGSFVNCVFDAQGPATTGDGTDGLIVRSNAGAGGAPDITVDFCTFVGDSDTLKSAVNLEIEIGASDDATATVTNSIFTGFSYGFRAFKDADVSTTGEPIFTGQDYNLFDVSVADAENNGAAVTPVRGPNSLTGDPLLADAPNGDYELTTGSPAIDAADPGSSVSDDLDGTARTDGFNDIGAQEFVPVSNVNDWYIL